MIIEKIEELKKRGIEGGIAPMEKDKIIPNLFHYISTELWFTEQLETNEFTLGKMKTLSEIYDVLCTLSARGGLTIKINGHSMVHAKKKMEMLRKLGERSTKTD